MKIIAFAGSNSSTSINKKLIHFTSSFFNEHLVEILDLNDFEMPIYKSDREIESGIPQLAKDFAAKIDAADLLLISLAEHNGAYATAFKNIFDWISRIPERKPWGDKNMFLMATSPGARGGASVLEIAKNKFPFSGAIVLETFSLPSFLDNFNVENGITNQEKLDELISKINFVKTQLN